MKSESIVRSSVTGQYLKLVYLPGQAGPQPSWTPLLSEATVMPDDRAMKYEAEFYGAYRIEANPVL